MQNLKLAIRGGTLPATGYCTAYCTTKNLQIIINTFTLVELQNSDNQPSRAQLLVIETSKIVYRSGEGYFIFKCNKIEGATPRGTQN